MNEVTEQARRTVIMALGELAGQFRAEARPCHFAASPLAEADVCATVRPSRPCADLNAAHRALAGMPGLVYLVQQKYELWAYLDTGERA